VIPTDLVAPAAQDLVLAAHPLDRAPDVPHVGVAGDRPQRLLLAAATDQDRQPLLDGRRIVAQVAHRVVLAARGGRTPVEHGADDLDRLVEPVEPLPEPRPEVDPVRGVLGLEPGATDAEDRPAAAQVVEGGGELGRERRVAERVGADHQPELRAGRRGGEPGEGQVALEDRPVGRADDRVEVVPREDRVVAEPVRGGRGVDHRLPRGVLRPDQRADPDRVVRHDGASRCGRWANASRRTCQEREPAASTRRGRLPFDGSSAWPFAPSGRRAAMADR
jgi:hypothetical protein